MNNDSAWQSQTLPAIVSDTTSEGKKVLTYSSQRRDSARSDVVSKATEFSAQSDAVSEATEVFSNGKWHRASAQIPLQTHEREEPINEEKHSSEPLEVPQTSLKPIKLDINLPEQVMALVWRFGREGGAFLSCIREGAIVPDNHGLEIGDELTSINGNFVRGLPKDEIEHIWMEIQDDENIDFLDLQLHRAQSQDESNQF